ncbi:MAG: lipopolysaccharide biosynthesis protein [Phycisphaeraceae bacterium]
MSLGRQIRSGVIWSSLGNVGGQAIFALVFFVLARLLDPKDFGLIAYAAVFASFFAVFLKLGYKDALVQIEDLQPGHLATVFWASAAIGVALAGLCALAAVPIAYVTGEPRLIPVIQALSVSSAIGGFNVVPLALLQRDFQFKAIANRTLLANVVGGAAGVAAAWQGLGVWALVIQRLLTELVALVLGWAAVDYRPIASFSFASLKQLSHYSNRVFGVNLVNYADQYIDQLLIGSTLNQVQLGYYAIGRRISLMLSTTLLDPCRAVTFPMFSKIQSDAERARRALYDGTRMVTTLTYPLFLGLAVLSPEAVAVAVGEKYGPVVELVWAFSLLGFYSSTMIMFIGVCKGMGKPAYILYQRLISVALNVALFAVVVRYGIFWVAIAFALRAFATSPLQLWFMRKAAGIAYGAFIRALVAPLAIAAISVGCGFAVRLAAEPHLGPLLRLVVSFAAILLVHAALVRLVMPGTIQQLKQLMARRPASTTDA